MNAPKPQHSPPAGGGERLTIGFVARATITVLGLWALGNMLWLGRELVFVGFFAVLVAAFLSIFVDRLERFNAPRTVAVMTIVVATLGLLLGAWMLTWPTLQQQAAVIREQLPQALTEIAVWIQSRYDMATGELINAEPQFWEQLRARAGEELAGLVGGALPLLNTVVGAVASLLVVIIAGVYLAVEPQLYIDGASRLVPPEHRPRVAETLRAIGASLRRWMLGTVINMIAVGVLTTLGLWLLGVPTALGLGLIAALLEFVPIIGPILSAVPAIAVALIVSPTQALYVLILYVAVQQIESNVLTPLVMKGAVRLPPALTMLFQAVMFVLFGFLGLLLAVPLLAVVIVAVESLYVTPLEADRGTQAGGATPGTEPLRRAG